MKITTYKRTENTLNWKVLMDLIKEGYIVLKY